MKKLNYGSYSVSYIQGYFEYIIKRHETFTDESPIQIHINKIQNKNKFKIKISTTLNF